MSDYSAMYRLHYSDLDGTTELTSFEWGADSVDVFRNVSTQAVGRFPVASFTRSAQEPGNSASVIAKEGGLIVARCPGATPSAEIGIISPESPTDITQLQKLTGNPSVLLWAFPGDWIYVRDSPGGRGVLDMFVRPLSLRELDLLVKLPRELGSASSSAAVSTVLLVAGGSIPFVPGVARTIYLVSPPAANTAYNLPAAAMVPPGHELLFVGMNARSFVLATTDQINGTTTYGDYFAPSFATVAFVSYGSGFAAQGTLQEKAIPVASGDLLVPWRGRLKLLFGVAVAEAFELPSALAVPGDAVLLALNAGIGDVTLAAAPTQFINTNTSIVVPSGRAVQLVPAGSRWIGVA